MEKRWRWIGGRRGLGSVGGPGNNQDNVLYYEAGPSFVRGGRMTCR